MHRQLSRRGFLRGAAAAAAAWPLAARSVRAAAVNGKLRTAHIGVGGMGAADLGSIASHPLVEVAALCDVDAGALAGAQAGHPKAETFRDYRELFDRFADKFDAVVVSTPDHTHAPASMLAMLNDKPVYCQKPLTHEVFEARRLREVAEQRGLVTQMGIQVHSAAPYRRAVKIIQSGVIGKVSAVHAWSDKNWGYDGPAPTNFRQAPENLVWDLWLGSAQRRPFVPGIYHQGQWRKIIDFGTGTLGDMGVHIFDTPYDALQLTAPNWAQTTCRPPTGVGHPEKNVVELEFPGTEFTTPTLRWMWYDGANAPPRSEQLELPAGMQLPGQGALFVGAEGWLLLPHVGESQLFPTEKFADYQLPEIAQADHYHQWVDACMGEGQTSASFTYAGPLTEALLLGVVANRFPGQKLAWDAQQLQVTNLPDANALLRRTYRDEFAVEGL